MQTDVTPPGQNTHSEETHPKRSRIGVKNRSEINRENAKYVEGNPETGECNRVGTAESQDILFGDMDSCHTELCPVPKFVAWSLTFCVAFKVMAK